MSRRKWSAEEKLKIVLEGLRGDTKIAELCNRHQISQTQYYQWRDRLLEQGANVFERGGLDKKSERQESQIRKLKAIIGEMTVELKKNNW